MLERYTAIAPVYDWVSGEWPVYRSGRRLGIPLLRLSQGATVLDLGCGTGLSFPPLADAIGPSGRIVGVDSSPAMLRAAARRASRMPPGQVLLVQADAAAPSATPMSDLLPAAPDGIIFTYSLSLMHPWKDAWAWATGVARLGTRIAVVDMAVPTGSARLLAPAARVACRLGGADISAHPWERLRTECHDVTHETAWGGHVQVWAGTWSGKP